MKTTILFFLLILVGCSHNNNDPQPVSEISKLPPATQTGANTFGCLLDGEAFKPGITNNSYNCFYQLVDGEYYFNVNASYHLNGILKDIGIGTLKLSISQGQTFNLKERIYGNANGSLFIGNDYTGIVNIYETSITNTGELKITKLDFTHNIVSGTFWFNVKDNQNVIHHITDGRFDMQFTR